MSGRKSIRLFALYLIGVRQATPQVHGDSDSVHRPMAGAPSLAPCGIGSTEAVCALTFSVYLSTGQVQPCTQGVGASAESVPAFTRSVGSNNKAKVYLSFFYFSCVPLFVRLG